MDWSCQGKIRVLNLLDTFCLCWENRARLQIVLFLSPQLEAHEACAGHSGGQGRWATYCSAWAP